MSLPTIIVTGANRGIGQALCHKILTADPTLIPPPFRLLATSRTGTDLGFRPSSQDTRVDYPQLDISDSGSIQRLAGEVEKGSLRVLVNNAGVNLDGRYGVESAGRTMGVNCWGTLEMCRRFIPLLAPGGRIVNLSSVASSLKDYSPGVQQRFRDPDVTVEKLDTLVEEFLKSVQSSTEQQSGFGPPGRSYSVSKACVNAMTHFLARDNPGLIINAVCPGWVATDMGQQIGRPPKKPEEGARVPFRVGFGDIGGVTGRYWANDSVRSREDGKVQEW